MSGDTGFTLTRKKYWITCFKDFEALLHCKDTYIRQTLYSNVDTPRHPIYLYKVETKRHAIGPKSRKHRAHVIQFFFHIWNTSDFRLEPLQRHIALPYNCICRLLFILSETSDTQKATMISPKGVGMSITISDPLV